MRRPELDPDAAAALAGAMRSVATSAGHEPSEVQTSFIDAVSATLLSAPHAPGGAGPRELAAEMQDDLSREFAAEVLILTALVDARPDPRCVAAADDFCRALERAPENLRLLHEVTHRHIRRSRYHLFRRFLADSLRTGSLSGDLVQLEHLYRDRRADPAIAEPYLALEDLPEDTLGRAFHDFYRNRGFPFPGEAGALPVPLKFEVHDSLHLLSGYNTDARDEINVMAFQAGATSTLPWLLLTVNLVTFNNGLAYGPTHLLHYSPHEGNLDPTEFVRALDRGLACRRDLSGDLDIHAVFPRGLEELRIEFGLPTDVPDVRVPD